MTRRLILPAVLLLGLTACSSSTSDEDATAAPTATSTATLSAEAQTCESFYEGMGSPLAERAEAARASLSAGEVEDGAAYAEINALEQRLSDLAADAPNELATLLEEVNAPLSEAVATVNEASAEEPAEGEEAPGFPDLSQIDVSGSESAQQEIEAACTEAGYGA